MKYVRYEQYEPELKAAKKLGLIKDWHYDLADFGLRIKLSDGRGMILSPPMLEDRDPASWILVVVAKEPIRPGRMK